MGASDVGDETTGGLGSLGECLDVAGMACPHLDDGDVVVGRQAQQRLGYADIVVEVALGVEHVVLLLEHGGDELLRCRFAVGAGDGDDGDIELAAVLTGNVLEGLEAVVDSYQFRI